jgi:nitroreductase
MDFLALAKKRCSTRAFLQQQITDNELNSILEAARVAPTNGNIQNFKIYVVQEKALLHTIYQHAQCYNAPTVLVVTYDTTLKFISSINKNDSGLIDTSVILTHMMLEATDLNIGSVWINYFKQKSIHELLGLSKDVVVAHLLAIGYPSVPFSPSDRHKNQRKSVDELVSFIKESN